MVYSGNATISDLPALEGKALRMVDDLVADKIVRHQTTKHGYYMKFGTFLDVKGDFFHTSAPGKWDLLVIGVGSDEVGCPDIEVQKAGRSL